MNKRNVYIEDNIIDDYIDIDYIDDYVYIDDK